MATVNDVPATWEPGLATQKALTVPGATVKVPDVPVLPAGAVLEVTVNAVDWASDSVTPATVACPVALSATLVCPDAHEPWVPYTGAVAFGLFAGPLKVTQLVTDV